MEPDDTVPPGLATDVGGLEEVEKPATRTLMTDHTADEICEPAVAYDERGRESSPIRHGATARSVLERLVARGRIRPAKGDLRDLPKETLDKNHNM